MKRKLTACLLAFAMLFAYAAPAALALTAELAAEYDYTEVIYDDIGIAPFASDDFARVGLGIAGVSGGVNVECSVQGRYTASSIGIYEIELYKATSNGSTYVRSYGPYSASNASSFSKDLFCSGTSGTEYAAIVTFFINKPSGGTAYTTEVTRWATAK